MQNLEADRSKFISRQCRPAVTVFDLKTDSTWAVVRVTGDKPDAIMYDPFTRRVFTFNGDGSNATAIDAQSLKVVGTVPLTAGPEFAVSDYKGHLFVNIEDKNSINVIDPQSLKMIAEWPLTGCERPTSMAIDRSTRRLFVGCRSRVMAVVDADNGHVITTLPIGSGVDATAFDKSKQEIFNSNKDGSVTIIKIDGPDTYSLVGTLTTSPGSKTMALDELRHQLLIPARRAPHDSTGSDEFQLLVYDE